MPDLVLNLNFSESKRKNQIILETYSGTILKLKSKKYSGLLRNVNINSLSGSDNLTDIEFEKLLNFLNRPSNVQIDKNQYIISSSNLSELESIAKLNCLFYRKDRKSPMYQIEEISYDDVPKAAEPCEIENVIFGSKTTRIYFDIKHKENNLSSWNVKANFYIKLSEKNYPSELVFDNNNFKNFGFEQRIKNIIEENNWKYKHNDDYFEYTGYNFAEDVGKLIENGINVYTDTQKRITTGDFKNINVFYNIDWFEIKGKVSVDENEIEISELIDLSKKLKNWTEYNGKIILLPEAFNNHSIKKDNTGELSIDKKNIVDAIMFSQKLNRKAINNLDEYTGYEKINLNIDKNIEKILRPYQITGVKWLLSLRKNNFGGCLADDMGLGKTLQIIAFLSDETLKNSRNIIIVPKTLLVNWEREFQKFLPDVEIYTYHGINRDFSRVKSSKITLSTYGTVLNDIDKLSEINFYNMILDEAQYVKNSSGKTYRALTLIKADTKIILTGTPVENNIREFWGLMKLVNNNILPSYENFSTDKIKLMTSPFILRRLKKDVLKDLPEKLEQIVYCEMGEEQSELYKNILAGIRYEILRKNNRYEIKDNSIILKGLLYLQETCCHPLLLNRELNKQNCSESAKLEVLENILKNAYESGHKIVVFSRFTRMLKLIEERINFLHMNYYYLDGKTKNRIELVEEFEKSNSGIFLISLKAGGTGINLVSADVAVIYDPWWNPAVEKQAEDRIYRIGQKNNVLIYRLIMVNTIEEKIYKLQHEKQDLYSEILDGHEIPTKFTIEIMRQLIL